MARALEIGTAEGLEAVSLRRLAQELGVTPMALYRHVRDKQDLINAMTEVVLEGIDATAGFRPGMTWTERLRLAIDNYKEQIDARPLALPLSIAYNGEGPPSFWRVLERPPGHPARCGFCAAGGDRPDPDDLEPPRGLPAAPPAGRAPDVAALDAHQLDLLRRRFALAQLSLPRDEFPNLVESAEDTAEVWLTDPNQLVGEHGRPDHVRLGANARAQPRRITAAVNRPRKAAHASTSPQSTARPSLSASRSIGS